MARGFSSEELGTSSWSNGGLSLSSSSSPSSSELLRRRRIPARTGDGGFFCSICSDLGRYFGLGKAEPDSLGLGRKDDDRVRTVLGLIVVDGEEDFSSEEFTAGLGRAESLREALVIVLLSGVVSLASDLVTGGLSKEGRGAVRREMVESFVFFASFFSLSPSLLSLCITPVRKFRMEELLVAGAALGLKPTSAGIVAVKE